MNSSIAQAAAVAVNKEWYGLYSHVHRYKVSFWNNNFNIINAAWTRVRGPNAILIHKRRETYYVYYMRR